MFDLEMYAAGLRDLDKILELDHQLSSIPGLREKVDRNHNLVYLELDQPTITFREIRAIFRKLALDPHLSARFRRSFGRKRKRGRLMSKV